LASSVFAATHATENIFLITVDGLRWQEVSEAREPSLINKENGVDDTNRLNAAFFRPTPEERRRALLPFFGNDCERRPALWQREQRQRCQTDQWQKFTYPGFNEIFTGLQMLELTRTKSAIIPMYRS
jgi:hypothetical protein